MNVTLTGSRRAVPPGATLAGRPEPTLTAEVTVLLRNRTPLAPRPGTRLSRAELTARHGADPADAEAVTAFAARHDLTVLSTDLARRTMTLSGTLAALSVAFGVEFGWYDSPAGRHRGREGVISLPADLEPVIDGVFGLDERPAARPHSSLADTTDPAVLSAADIAALYGFPANSDGTGQTIALIELGGAHRPADTAAYCAGLGLPVPRIETISVDGAPTDPGAVPPNSSDSEVALDIQVTAAAAPGAALAVYFAPNTERGFLDVLSTAIHDAARNPSVLSISWGAAEALFTAAAQQAFDQLFAEAALLGITVCCSTGDAGSGAGQRDGRAHVELPASSPHALACGGTTLTVSSGAIAREVVWQGQYGSSGGGISEVFGPPGWQRDASVPACANPGGAAGRGLPDLAGNADHATAYRIVVAGRSRAVGGTSAVAPLLAALTARINQTLGRRAGWIAPLLYNSAVRSVFRPVREGSNGAYRAGEGWNPCTGLGVPDGSALLAALTDLIPTTTEEQPG
ncbi:MULTISPECIES: S53 family peptidase [Amycolatopsis]|uniref:Protease pro-enzyme activation domain-containing protein n=2 Tax=Amycolatopsis TaxID=1813 RepID=A0ABW5I4U4_9PSEU